MPCLNSFYGSWDAKFDVYTDLCEFYILWFNPAYSGYAKENKNFEKEYQCKFRTIKVEKLEKKLKECLTKIVEIYPKRKEEDKTAFIFQASKLFELEEILSDSFYKELMKY